MSGESGEIGESSESAKLGTVAARKLSAVAAWLKYGWCQLEKGWQGQLIWANKHGASAPRNYKPEPGNNLFKITWKWLAGAVAAWKWFAGAVAAWKWPAGAVAAWNKFAFEFVITLLLR